MLAPILQGTLIGAAAGVGVGLTSLVELGPIFWGLVSAVIGGSQGWIGWWILKQSHDVPKMRAAVPLSGAVLASVVCVFTGEGFLLPVTAGLVTGMILGVILARAEAASSSA